MSVEYTVEGSLDPAKMVKLPSGGEVPIDVKMIPLVKALWKLGYTTRACCQGNENDPQWGYRGAYVSFANGLTAADLLHRAGALHSVKLLRRKRPGWAECDRVSLSDKSVDGYAASVFVSEDVSAIYFGPTGLRRLIELTEGLL